MPPETISAAAFAEASLQALMGSALPVGLAVLDTELRFVQVNPILARANGLSMAKHLGRSVREVLPHAADALEPALLAVLESGEASHHRQMSDDAREAFQWESHYRPIRSKAGHVVGVLVQAQNRARERRARARLQMEGEQHLRRVLDSLFVFVGVLNPQGVLLEANRAPLEAAGVKLDEVRGLPLWDTVWWAGDGQRQAWLRTAVERAAAGELVRSDVEIRMAEGQAMVIDFMLAPLRDDAGHITQLIGSAIDVTERRAAQGEIERALREKTVLLHELHHRVKNNLQVISSLLNLQSNGAEPGVKAALRDSQSRVRSMALMHQLLYERSDFSALELGPYLHRLGSLLRDTYLGEGAAGLQLRVSAPETGLLIDLQRAIPCGLLVTELVTNAIKHGFPDGGPGRIEVGIAVQANGEACVDVRDDGMGLGFDDPEGALTRAKGLGFQLLPVLAEQCKARLEQCASEGGTHFRLHLALSDGLAQAGGRDA